MVKHTARLGSRHAIAVVALACACAGCGAAPAAFAGPLRVCADPNNLPFSNEAGEGFENRLAELMASALGRSLEYTWWPQRRGFVRSTLNAGRCDLIMSVPGSFELAWTTRPYYRSTYVFVQREDASLRVRSLDDAALRELTVGVHLIGDDYTNTPGAQALARRGITDNVVGYSIYGDYSQPNPPARLIEAVANGEVDVAIAWGPLAGYFAPRQSVQLALTPVSPQIDLPYMPFVFDIAMAVRRADTTLHTAVERVLVERADDIGAVLRQYAVPLLDSHAAPAPARQEAAGPVPGPSDRLTSAVPGTRSRVP